MSEYQSLRHTFPPIYDQNSRILILGTFPSVKSRELSFYYGHPQNRFWKVLAGIQGVPIPQTIQEKTEFLLEQRIAIWDVIASCDIIGSSDSSIRNVVPADLSVILDHAPSGRYLPMAAKLLNCIRNILILPRTGRSKSFHPPARQMPHGIWID